MTLVGMVGQQVLHFIVIPQGVLDAVGESIPFVSLQNATEDSDKEGHRSSMAIFKKKEMAGQYIFMHKISDISISHYITTFQDDIQDKNKTV